MRRQVYSSCERRLSDDGLLLWAPHGLFLRIHIEREREDEDILKAWSESYKA